LISLLSVLSISFIGCGSVAERPVSASPEKTENKAELSLAEQEEKSVALFQQVFEMVGKNDRSTVLDKIESAYREIADKYPKAPLAQECYWRLITLYLNDYNPPLYDKIEATYAEFIKKYPDSPFREETEDNIAKMYYIKGQWDKLMRFYAPAIKKFIATGKLGRPQEIFLYSEAKMKLGDLTESEKGFKIVMANFPDTREASLAAQRLDAIAAAKSKQH